MGELPFGKGATKLDLVRRAILYKKVLLRPGLSIELKDFIYKCLEWEPLERGCLNEVIENSFFKAAAVPTFLPVKFFHEAPDEVFL